MMQFHVQITIFKLSMDRKPCFAHPQSVKVRRRSLETSAGAFQDAFWLISTFDADLVEIIALSLRITLAALVIATLLGLPLGALLATQRFPGRGGVILIVNALMGLPPVVAGLLVYLLLSRSGPLGPLQLLYTPAAMIIAQAVLITPIIAALSRQILEDLATEYDEQLRALAIPPLAAIGTLLWDARFSLLTVVLAGFGRAIAEVGSVMIVGGNINHVTRTMTTAIALETSRGNLSLALGLGIVLLAVALAVNIAVMSVRSTAARTAFA
jgi:tungstate transport system permease protein